MRQSERWLLDQILSNPRTVNLKYAHFASIHVAVLMKRGRIIAEATNGFGSRSRGSGYCASSIHAERNVVKEIGNIHELKGAEMYVVRISRNKDLECEDPFVGSKPCSQCRVFLEKCMKEYGLKNVYYTPPVILD
uniref:CMP/dCMP-type deaminase domain-containing protein n=1 Tax=viral metagenome TaxID=1070528 RepID=A0A6C0AMM3_9ZZZZ